MATINTKELLDGVKDFLEKIGCTDVQIVDTDYQAEKKASRTVRETMNGLPKTVQIRIERFRSDMKTDSRHREVYVSKGNGYIEGLRDSGLITEYEHRMLKSYLAV